MRGVGAVFAEDYVAASPVRYMILPQMRLEPILLARARELNPGGVRICAMAIGIEEGSERVRVHVRYTHKGLDTPVSETVEAQYVVVADGGRFVADALGIRLHGERSIADMELRNRCVLVTMTDQPWLAMQSQWAHIETIADSPKQPRSVGWTSLNGVNPNGAALDIRMGSSYGILKSLTWSSKRPVRIPAGSSQGC